MKRNMKAILISLIFGLVLYGCSNNKNSLDINKLMEENDYIIVDVRTELEYQQSHVVGAINVPYDEIDNSFDKDKIIFVYCKSGSRSQIAFETLTALGYRVYNLGAYSEIDLPKE